MTMSFSDVVPSILRVRNCSTSLKRFERSRFPFSVTVSTSAVTHHSEQGTGRNFADRSCRSSSRLLPKRPDKNSRLFNKDFAIMLSPMSSEKRTQLEGGGQASIPATGLSQIESEIEVILEP